LKICKKPKRKLLDWTQSCSLFQINVILVLMSQLI
jgi:hypothetical protein